MYVDKTDLVYKMVQSGKYYFLSRPRRFGKTLLMSTLKSYFRGDKESFRGLAIEQLEKDWKRYPVLTLTLSKGKFDTIEDLHSCLRGIFSDFEKKYGRNGEEKDFAERFNGVIKRAYEQTGRQVVILIDEYDDPFQAAIDKPELMAQFQGQMRDIYLCLKKSQTGNCPILRSTFYILRSTQFYVLRFTFYVKRSAAFYIFWKRWVVMPLVVCMVMMYMPVA